MMSKEDLTAYIHAKQSEARILSHNHLEGIDNYRLNFYKLKEHIDNFLKTNGEYYNRCIMMPGLRGLGKTTILYQLYDYLISEKRILEEDILFLDLHDLKSISDIGLSEIFNIYLEEMHHSIPPSLDKKIFLFVDEAQLDKNWANFAKLIFDKTFNVFMVFTGSSALDLELNTDATRRITKENIFPCSFEEYLLLKHNIHLSNNNFKDLILKGDMETVDKAIECEDLIKKEFISLNNLPNIELKKYVYCQAFPFALNLNETIIYNLTNDIIEKIVYDDLADFYEFKNSTNSTILRIIAYLAIKKPGSTSNSAIAQSLNINIRTVNNILSALEKSQLLFSINAYGSAGKMLKKPKQHFFLSPTLKSAQNFRVGRYSLGHDKCYASLVENLVATSLNRLSNETMQALGLFYDSNKKGVDFIVKHLERTIPIEVGIGSKTKSQVIKAINKYDAEYGILISNRTNSIKFENDVIYIPISSFALM